MAANLLETLNYPSSLLYTAQKYSFKNIIEEINPVDILPTNTLELGSWNSLVLKYFLRNEDNVFCTYIVKAVMIH